MKTKDLAVGMRVYYREGGEEDTGTVIAVRLLSDEPIRILPGEEKLYMVEWDNGPEDEKVDWFPGHQLVGIPNCQLNPTDEPLK